MELENESSNQLSSNLNTKCHNFHHYAMVPCAAAAEDCSAGQPRPRHSASVRPAERRRSCQLTVLAMEADTARGKQELVKVGMMLISTIREQKKRLRAVYS